MTFQNVLVTGASSGLGRGLALHYAQSGATVFALARRAAELESLAEEVGAGKGKIVPVALDVGDLEALAAAIHRAEEQSGGALDLVIANAGIGNPTDARELDWRLSEKILHVNANAACATLAAALPAMVARNSGTVVGVSSLAAMRGMPSNAAYSASKAALRVYLESLRVDLRETKVKALTIYPGFVHTELTAKNKFKMPFVMQVEDAVSAMARGIARGRRGISFPLPMALGTRWLASLPEALYEWVASSIAPPRPRRKEKKLE